MKNMEKTNFKSLLGVTFSLVMLVAATGPFTSQVVEATSATTYTRTINSDGIVIRCQDGYLPETTYDRIGLDAPQDMVTDVVIENGKEVEYGYILNQGKERGKPFITKFPLDNVSNYTEIDIGSTIPYIKEPTGLWLRTTTVHGVTRKELYIADAAAQYKETFKATEIEKDFGISDYEHTYTGLVYRVQFNMYTNELLLDSNNVTWIHEPSAEASRDLSHYEVIEYNAQKEPNKLEGRMVIPTNEANFKSSYVSGNDTITRTIVCKIGHEDECSRIVPVGQFLMKTPSYGQDTLYRPKKVSVDDSGNMFIASEGTFSGMIQLSYSGEFVSFYVVNTVAYDFLYQFIRNFGTQSQLDKLTHANPPSFSNVFIDNENLVYSVTHNHTVVFDKYSTGGSSILETPINLVTLQTDQMTVTDSFVTEQGLIFLTLKSGLIYVFAPNGSLIFFFGSTPNSSSSSNSNIVGFFNNLQSLIVDDENRIWVIDSDGGYLQTFTPTAYANSIITAITSFNDQQYEVSRNAWEQVLQYDSLSVLGNDGLGKAYYYDQEYGQSLKYFAVSKNRTLYSNVFWEQRNDYLQQNLGTYIIILIAVVAVFFGLKLLFKHNKKLRVVKEKASKIRDFRWVKDLTVGFRMITKPNDTFYEVKSNRRGSVWAATIYYILGIVAFMLNTYCYALPFQYITTNSLNPSTVFFATIAVLAVFVLCNYLVSAINDGEGTFLDIYKFTGYSLLPMIICLPLGVGISYGLTLNEEVVITLLKTIGFWGTGIYLVIGILETHNYTFGQTVKNILLTIIFMVLFIIICMVVVIMVDQIKTFIETIWKEVKLRVGWY